MSNEEIELDEADFFRKLQVGFVFIISCPSNLGIRIRHEQEVGLKALKDRGLLIISYTEK
jgi:hypothetical protein